MEGNLNTEYASLSGKIHTLVIDKTLTISGAAAEAKATGEAIEKAVGEVRDEVAEYATEQALEAVAEQAEGIVEEAVNNLTAGDLNAYTKEEVLSESTKTLLELPESYTPNDLLNSLGLYRWKRRTYTEGYISELNAQDVNVIDKGEYSDTVTVYFGSEYSLDSETGLFTLTGETGSVSVSYSTYENLSNVVGGYMSFSALETPSDTIYDCRTATYEQWTESWAKKYYYVGLKGTYVMTSKYAYAVGAWELLTSLERSAYPDCGIVDGYQYLYCGVAFDKTDEAPRLLVGSYEGTGVYGTSNPNTLTFESRPLVVLVLGTSVAVFDGMADSRAYNVFTASGLAQGVATWSGAALSFYSETSAEQQLNTASELYNYIAIFA